MDELQDILDGNDETPMEVVEAPQEPQQTEQPQEAEAPTEGPVRDESGRFAPKGESDAPPASEDKAESGLKAGIAAERRKRQEIESRYDNDLKALREELAALKQGAAPAPPSLWEDDQAWQEHYGKQITEQAIQGATMQSKLQTSELLVMQQHEDFMDLKPQIFEFVGNNPGVNQQVSESAHPWQTAYKAFKNHQTMQELGAVNVDDLKAKLLEQIKAEQAQQPAAQPNIPRSLADAQSARSTGVKPGGDDFTLENILGV